MEHFKLKFDPVANPDSVFIKGDVRFSVLTSRIIRMEYQQFEDRASQPFWYRNQPKPDFTVKDEGDTLEIETEYLKLRYDGSFSRQALSIELKGTDTVWHYGDIETQNLLGTTRTLDDISGQTVLEHGLLSRAGWVVIDDSKTLVFDDAGWLHNRKAVGLDLYFLGYGQAYKDCLADYCKLTGKVPLLPRWALGNWWSRYWAYTQEELTTLIEDFIDHEVPLSVCIVDMDWHITKTGNTSSGWTGYTWNRELFPEPTQLIEFFHDMGLKTALNLHPADGVHPHEEGYEAMVKQLGLVAGEPVRFQIADPVFTQAYFEVLHHPQEAQGVDFWWMDWQQGVTSGKTGLDPLWWLNHLHYYDLGRDGKKRPFIFSRWGGLGNHRYPIGFSGDTHVTWESLAYQPYFTSNAANVGYGWWSHDIGGHCFGIEDPELYIRWVQYGVFSPILRLHSTSNPYHERLPWKYDAATYRILRDAMQLRHALIPYLYSMSWRAYAQDLQPITPMYHDYPQEESAYHCPNQYTFGSELIAAPQIQPADSETGLSRQVVWLPKGDWFNFFDGEYYAGDSWNAIYGLRDEIPVFAKAGAIVPLAPKVGWRGIENPPMLDVYIFPGADNQFDLFEDDGETNTYLNGAYGVTTFKQTWKNNQQQVVIEHAAGTTTYVPAQRTYTLYFRGITLPSRVEAMVNGKPHIQTDYFYNPDTETLELTPINLQSTDQLVVTLRDDSNLMSKGDRRAETCRKFLRVFRVNTWAKYQIDQQLNAVINDLSKLSEIVPMLSPRQAQAVVEVLTGAGIEWITNASPRHQPLIMWNNREYDWIKYQLYKWEFWQLEPQSDVLPKCKILETVKFKSWKASVNYDTIFTTTLEGSRI